MRILFTRFPLESRYGGAEVQTITLMRGLKARGHDVAFLGSCPVLLEHTARRSLPAVHLDLGFPPVTKWLAVSFLWRQRAMRKKLITAIETPSTIHHPPSVIVMLSLSEKLLLTQWAVSRGIRVVWVEHDRVGRWLTWNPWLPRLRRLANLATTVVVSDMSRKTYCALGWPEQRLVAIPNGVEAPTLVPSPDGREKPLSPFGGKGLGIGGLRLGCLSRLTYDKGVDVLIDALRDCPDARLTIVGTGRDERCFRECAARSTARDRVDFLPNVRAPCDLYDVIDILVLPSREHDPFGLVAAEAMLHGIAVIVTDVCGIAGYLRSGIDALVVKAGDCGALAQAISQLSDPERRRIIAAAGLQTAHKQFTRTTMLERYETLLRNI